MIDGYRLFSGQNRMDGRNMRCREDADPVGKRGQPGGPRVRFETSMVEVDFATQAFPARDRNDGVKSGLLGGPGDSNTFAPVDFDGSVNERHGAPVTHIRAKHGDLQLVMF